MRMTTAQSANRRLSGACLIEIDGYAVGHRIALAREDEAARHFVVLQREIDVHVHLALDELAAARRAYAALARKGQLDAVAQAGVDDVLAALVHEERSLRAVDDDAHFRFRVRGNWQRTRDVRVLRDARGEALDSYALRGHPVREQ